VARPRRRPARFAEEHGAPGALPRQELDVLELAAVAEREGQRHLHVDAGAGVGRGRRPLAASSSSSLERHDGVRLGNGRCFMAARLAASGNGAVALPVLRVQRKQVKIVE
jgi:hypothetical protein